MADTQPTFVCQQCKQPIQLDPSVIEATPESVQESLLPLTTQSTSRKDSSTKSNNNNNNINTTNSLTPTQRLARLNASPAAKAAWEAATSSSSANTTTTTANANAGLRARDKDDFRLLPATSSSPSPSSSSSPSSSTTPGRHRKTNSVSGTGTNMTTTTTMPTMMMKREGTTPSPSGTESFVLLPGNVAGKIPKNGSISTKSSSPSSNPTGGGSRVGKQQVGSTPPRRTHSTSGGGQTTSATTTRKIASTSTSDPSSTTNHNHTTTTTTTAPNPLPSTSTLIPSNNLHATMRLFTLLSSHSELDHPLCADCTNTLRENLERKLEETKRERDGYLAFEREVRKNQDSVTANGLDEKKLEQRIQRLEAESQRATAELKQAEQERLALESELAALKEEEDALEVEEIAFWTERSRTQLQQAHTKDSLASITAALSNAQRELANLARTNVYNDSFCIGHDGVFGTINGLRLGRVPGTNVEWAEINAAWGEALLLLYTIARKVDFIFETYRLIPMGSFSKIERIQGDKGTYELYGSGDINITRVLHNRRFDYAMVAFLDCLRQLMEHVRARDPSVDFPHTIIKDKIGDVSIKLQFSQEEVWTKAMRHVLLALKILLRWATSG